MLALRNLARRRMRFMLTMLLLAGAGMMFLTSMNLKAGWQNTVAQAAADRHFDLELRFQQSVPAKLAMASIGAVAAVRQAEAWSIAPATLARDGALDMSHSYPDGGHGSLALRAAPPATTLVARAMNAGRWLRADDIDAAVLNSQALSTFPGARVGSRITVKLVLVWALGFIAAMMAVVGLLGLASSLGASVLERTREFGVMRALGASSGAVIRGVLYEGMLTALASSVLAMMLASLPSAVVGAALASVSSQALSLNLSPSAALLWLAGSLVAALAVSYFPARRAAGLTIRQTLDWEYG